MRDSKGRPMLPNVASKWPTPGANDHKGTAKVGQRGGRLDEAAEQKFQQEEEVAPWTPCPCCENYLCNIHGTHAHDCPCSGIEEWETSPYLPGPPAPKET